MAVPLGGRGGAVTLVQLAAGKEKSRAPEELREPEKTPADTGRPGDEVNRQREKKIDWSEADLGGKAGRGGGESREGMRRCQSGGERG